MTPPWVRFLGRKVYLGAVVILIGAVGFMRLLVQGNPCWQ
jgi:hypothetical protein